MGKLKDLTLKKAFCLIVAVTAAIVLLLSAVSVRACSRIHDRITLSHGFRMNAAVVDPQGSGRYIMEAETGGGEDADARLEFTGEELWICRVTEVLMVLLPILFSFLGIVCAGAFFYHVKLREPLAALKRGISHIADNDLDFRIDYGEGCGKRDELGELCRAFETMRGELVKNNRYMWGLVEERKRINASIAHDLRTPITVIKGYSEYLDRNAGKEALTGDGTREIAGYINQAAVRLEEYADSVREVQALEDMRLEYGEVLLDGFLEEMRAQLSVIAEQNRKEIRLRARLPEQAQTVALSAAAVFRILENIVDNALRYCRERIEVEVSFAAPFLTIVITDDGKGFSEKGLAEATDYFYKGKLEKGQSMEGKHSLKRQHFGIGLTICRILAQKHGGTILLGNAPEGGAQVTVSIKTEEICCKGVIRENDEPA